MEEMVIGRSRIVGGIEAVDGSRVARQISVASASVCEGLKVSHSGPTQIPTLPTLVIMREHRAGDQTSGTGGGGVTHSCIVPEYRSSLKVGKEIKNS